MWQVAGADDERAVRSGAASDASVGELVARARAGECWAPVSEPWSAIDVQELSFEWVRVPSGAEITATPDPELTEALKPAMELIAAQDPEVAAIVDQVEFDRLKVPVDEVLSEGASSGVERTYTISSVDRLMLSELVEEARTVLIGVADEDGTDDRVQFIFSSAGDGGIEFHGACAETAIGATIKEALATGDTPAAERFSQVSRWIRGEPSSVVLDVPEPARDGQMWNDRRPRARSLEDPDIPTELRASLIPVVLDLRLLGEIPKGQIYCLYAEIAWTSCSEFGASEPLTAFVPRGRSMELWLGDRSGTYETRNTQIGVIGSPGASAPSAVYVVELSASAPQSSEWTAESLVIDCRAADCADELRQSDGQSVADLRSRGIGRDG